MKWLFVMVVIFGGNDENRLNVMKEAGDREQCVALGIEAVQAMAEAGNKRENIAAECVEFEGDPALVARHIAETMAYRLRRARWGITL